MGNVGRSFRKSQKFHGLFIHFSGKIFFQRQFEKGIIRNSQGEQRHAGMKFEIIGKAENFRDWAALDLGDESGALTETLAEFGVGRVSPGLVQGMNGKLPGHFTPAQAL